MKPIDVLAALVVVVLWGVNFAMAKMVVTEIPPLFAMGLRFALVGAMLAWVGLPTRSQMREIAILSVVLGTLHFGLIYVGISGVDASVAAILMQLGTPLSVLLGWAILGETIGWRRAIGTAVAFAGIVVLAGEPHAMSSTLHVGIILFAALMWAFSNIQTKRVGRIDSFVINGWTALLSSPQLFLLSFIVETGQMASFETASLRAWGALAYAAFLSSLVAYGLWYYLLGRYEVTRLAPIALLSPAIGILSGILILGEPLTMQKVIGGFIVITGVAIIEIRMRGKRVPEAGVVP